MKRRAFIKSTGAAGLITVFDPSGVRQLVGTNIGSTLEEKF
jgi:hypothetical protein